MPNIKCEGLKLDYTQDVEHKKEYPEEFHLYTMQILNYNRNQDMKDKLNIKNKLGIINFTQAQIIQLDDLFAMFEDLGMRAKIWKNLRRERLELKGD